MQLLQIFESNGGDLSPAQFEEFSLPYLAQIAKGIKEGLKRENLPSVPLTVFARGANWEGVLEKLADTEFDTVGLDWRIEPQVARKRIPATKKTIQGNLDPCTLYASKEDIYGEVVNMLEGFGTERYIANLGHGMHPDHDPEHAHAFILAVQEVSSKMNQK
uniref:Uroporphyrinogen decarboxylase (URO-D) domain-containing protein n=1 Tax=Aplanochytrium stocchinoi TaxID=215587 RepID=A0A7S3PQY4_9STRA